ncbi:MAG: DedA family protein, partial [Gemmatimonadota bacterium]|nr:DedA family protein [Gemmatimonadota bacterium]
WQYLGAFIGIFLEESGVPLPVPGDVFIAALGASGRAGHANYVVTTLIVVGATVTGSAILFEISRRLGEPLLRKIGHRFGFDGARADRVEEWLNTHGTLTVALGRLVPGFRILLTVAAGALRMGRARFLLGAAAAAVLWAAIYYWLGYALGAGVERLIRSAAGRAVRNPEVAAALVVVGVAVIVAAIVMVVLRRKNARESAEADSRA